MSKESFPYFFKRTVTTDREHGKITFAPPGKSWHNTWTKDEDYGN